MLFYANFFSLLKLHQLNEQKNDGINAECLLKSTLDAGIYQTIRLYSSTCSFLSRCTIKPSCKVWHIWVIFLRFHFWILDYIFSHERETEKCSAPVIKLWVRTELSDSIIESWDVLKCENKQKSYICSSIWSDSKLLVVMMGPHASLRRLQAARGHRKKLSASFLWTRSSRFHAVDIGNLGQLARIKRECNLFLFNSSLTQGRLMYQRDSWFSKTCEDSI